MPGSLGPTCAPLHGAAAHTAGRLALPLPPCRLQHKAFHAEMAAEAAHRDDRI